MTAVVLLQGCGLAHFDVNQDLAEQTIQGNALGTVLPDFLPNPFKFNIDIQSETQKRGTGPATAAFLKSLTLQVTPHATPKGNFDFLTEVHLFAAAPGLTKVEVARLNPVPRGVTHLEFELLPNVNLLPYINAGATLDATASAKSPAQDTSFDGEVVVDVRI